MIVRKAESKDIEHINRIYISIHDAEERGELSVGWSRNIYPVMKTAEDALRRGDMFVCEDGGEVAAAAIINRIQLPEYKNCRWKYEASENEVMVMHTLVVAPDMQGKGYGAKLAGYYEEYAKEHKSPYLRMDTQEKNTAARAFYRKLGYEERGTVGCVFNGIPDVRLVCLEKKV